MICEAKPLGGTTKFGSAPLEDMEEQEGGAILIGKEERGIQRPLLKRSCPCRLALRREHPL